MLSNNLIKTRLEKNGVKYSDNQITRLKNLLYFLADISLKDYFNKY
jgi:hypothetical protein